MSAFDALTMPIANMVTRKAGQKGKTKNDAAKKGNMRDFIASLMQYDEAYYNGMIRKGREYSILYEIPNVTFRGISKDKQEKVMEQFVDILNSFDSFLKNTLVIANIRENGEIGRQVRYPTDRYTEYATELNRMFKEYFSKHNAVTTYRLLVIKGAFDSPADADNQFSIITNNLDDLFSQSFECRGEVVSIGRRAHLITSILKRDYYDPYLIYDKDSNDYEVDTELLKKRHQTMDDILYPQYLRFHTKDFEIDDRVARSYVLTKIGNSINTDFLYSIYSIDAELVIAIDLNGMESEDAIRKLNTKYSQILAEVDDKQGFQTLEQVSEQESILDMQDAVLNRDEKSYNASVVITAFAEDMNELAMLQEQIYAKAKRYTCRLEPIFAAQHYGFMSCCLMGFYTIEFKRFFDAHSIGAFIPFDVPEYFDGDGIYYGLHKINHLPIFYDRNKNDNYNALVLGCSGGGKSFFVKREILLTRLRYPKDHIYIIDPDGEYAFITEQLGGEVVNLAPGNGIYLNPMDLDIDDGGDTEINPMVAKTDLVASIVETMMGGGITLNSKSRSILDRCVRKVYSHYLKHLSLLSPDASGKRPTIDRSACPTLQDVYDELMRQNEIEAQEMAVSIESYITGSFDTFAHRTNINTSNSFIDFNIRGLGESMRDLGLRVCFSELWNRMIHNRAQNTWTRMFIDEFHNLLASPLSGNFCKKLWKQARKWMGAATGITQNVEDLLQSSVARAIINNSALIVLLKQSELDQEILSQILHLDETDLRYVNKVKPGSGLIVTDGIVIPFYDEFPKNTACFKLLDTSPEKRDDK